LLLTFDGTIKVKLTGDLSVDLNALKVLKNQLSDYNSKLRFDANQSYSFENAVLLFQFFKENNLENKVQYIEQPLPVGCESDMGKLRKQFENIEIMLDESVVDLEDLFLAIANNINYVKLKLFKQGGIKETLEIARKAKEFKIKVIFGNGVATHISNKIENHIYLKNKDLFNAPLESNGFLKVVGD
jgi:L-alanine-DL-glutamate epimerase-like enolase superfamily enzyme